jgi:DNA mismatch repair protein MutS
VKNCNVAVLEEEDQVVFLYKIVDGPTDRSYGIYAAELAGVPDEAVTRAKELLFQLECGEHPHARGAKPKSLPVPQADDMVQLSMFESASHPVVMLLRKLDLNNVTPMQALNLLNEMKRECE